MLPQITEFSAGYYLIEDMYVEPDRELFRASMDPALYGYIESEVYDDQGVPVTVKYNKIHFSVQPNDSVPIDTLSVPPGFLDEFDESAPGSSPILLARPGSSYRVMQSRERKGYTGGL